MNIYLRELRANWKALCFWCLGILFTVGSGLGKYTAFDPSDKAVFDLFADLPKPILAMFGMVGVDLSTASGFYAVVYILLLIMGTIYASMLGANIIAKEERDKTSEFLFTRPVSRIRVITAKILAAFTNVLIFNAVCLLFSLGMGTYISSDEGFIRDIVMLSLPLFLIQVLYLFMGTCMAAITKIPAASAGLSAAAVLVTYILSVVIDLVESFEFLKYLTPFKYFEARNIIQGGSIESLYILISLMLMMLFLAGTYLFFPRRDLTI